MTDFQRDPHENVPPIATLLICAGCQGAMRVELKTPVALTESISTVTLVCSGCGRTIIENCQT